MMRFKLGALLAILSGMIFMASMAKDTDFKVKYSVDLSTFDLPSSMPVKMVADFYDRSNTPSMVGENEIRWLAEPKALTPEQTKKILTLLGKPVLVEEWPSGLMQGPTLRIEFPASETIKVRYLTFYFHESEPRLLCTINSLPFALQGGKEFKRNETHPYYELFWAVGRERVGP